MSDILPKCHDFQPKTYIRPTFCFHCNKLLVSIYKQGVKCESIYMIRFYAVTNTESLARQCVVGSGVLLVATHKVTCILWK